MKGMKEINKRKSLYSKAGEVLLKYGKENNMRENKRESKMDR